MIETFVKRPATTIMMVLFFVLLGLVSFTQIRTELYPQIDFPLVSVNIVYPGASPLEIESEVLRRLEDEIVEVPGIKQMESQAFESAGFILIEFELSEDVNVKTAEVKDKVEAILNDLPNRAERPIVQRIDPFATAVVNLVLRSENHSTTELYEFADKNLRQFFSRITGVGSIDLLGGQARQIKIDLAPDLMAKHFISISEVINEIGIQNLTLPGGNIDRERSLIAVRFIGEFESLDQIRNMLLTNRDGDIFKLKDIAKVYDGSERVESIARFEGENALAIGINKVSDGNDVEVSEGVQRVLKDIEEILPQGMTLDIAVDQSVFIVRETLSTYKSILIGIALTVLVLFFFTGNPKITVIASVVIPSSLVSAIFLMESSGFTINFMTLLAMATSLGTLIANAIVIVESVLRQLEKGKDPETAAIDGMKDVIVPVLAAGGTNLVVFTPIAFMGGIIGQFMMQFGLTVVYATIFSLIASFSLTPMMCALLLRQQAPNQKPNFFVRTSTKMTDWMLKEYRIIFNLMFKFPKSSIIFAILGVVGGFSVAPYIGNEFIPQSDQDRIEVKLTLPQGSNIQKTLSTVLEVESELMKYEEVENVFSNLGVDGQENASIIANLYPADERSRSDVQLIELITPTLSQIPGVEIEIIRGDGGGGGNADISIHIQGIDYDEMIKTSYKFKEIMQETGYFRSVSSSYKMPGTELNFYPNADAIKRLGLNNATIGEVVRASIYGNDQNLFKEDGEEYEIMIQIDDLHKNNLQGLSSILVSTNYGLIPLLELGEIRVERGTPNIRRRDRQRVIQLDAYIGRSTAGVIQAELTQAFNQIEMPAGHGFAFVGDAESQKESGQEIGKAFGLAVILTYMILAAIMNSFVHPFTISTSIFSSFAGVFTMLFFMNSSINIASMLAFVMLVGLAVNNAILILEEVELELKKDEKIPIIDAIWKGIQNKFRAVIMTSVAIISGTAPQMLSSDGGKASMGAVIVGGMIASIIFTFILTPQVYWYIERLRRWTRGIK